MKKLSSIFSTLLISGFYFFATVGSTFATSTTQSICPPDDSQFHNLCKLSFSNSADLVGKIVTILLVVAIILSLIFLIIGSIRWITSGGDKGKLDGARQAIVTAIVGLVLAFLAYAILSLILFLFTGEESTSFSIPTLIPD